MNWGLPTSVEIGGESYEIRTDFRVILDIFVMLSDPDLSGTDRAEGILQMFYVSPEDIPPQHLQEAVDAFSWFQNGGQEPDKRKSPKLVDWEQDYPLILPPINRIFGRDIREILMMRRPTPGASIGGRSSVRITISGTAPLLRSCASATKRRAARRLKRTNANGTAATATS